MNKKTRSILATAIGIAIPLTLSVPKASATAYTFTGTGDWDAPGSNPNWSPAVSNGLDGSTLDTAGNSATIQGAVNYNGGTAGDFRVGSGNIMTIDGGSWTQAAAAGNWIKVGGSAGTGTVVVQNGGSFVADGGLLRLGEDGGTGVITVASSAGSGGLKLTVNTEMSTASTINLQGGTNSFAQLAATGSLNVSGGTAAVSGDFNTASSSLINISGGSVNHTGNGNVNLNSASTFLLSGNGAFTNSGTGEFQPGGIGGAQGISGNATLTIAGLVAFQGAATQEFNIGGGALTIGSSFQDGIFSNGGYFNFTLNSTGSILFTNTGTGENNIFESQIRYLDTAYTSLNYSTVFNVSHPTGTQTLISLAVPEPSTWASSALGAGLLMVYRRKKALQA